jgi:hypothetical protein
MCRERAQLAKREFEYWLVIIEKLASVVTAGFCPMPGGN